MISYLVGKPIFHGSQLTLLVNGVGYLVNTHPNYASKIKNSDQVELFIHTHVKEDKLELYGFSNFADKDLFVRLIDISGVGPKTALQMFGYGGEAIIKAVQQANLSFFKSIPRVGKKLAQKIIIELKPKLGGLKDLNLKPLSEQEDAVVEALVGLGFDQHKVHQVLEQVDTNQLSLEQALKKTMKLLGQNK